MPNATPNIASSGANIPGFGAFQGATPNRPAASGANTPPFAAYQGSRPTIANGGVNAPAVAAYSTAANAPNVFTTAFDIPHLIRSVVSGDSGNVNQLVTDTVLQQWLAYQKTPIIRIFCQAGDTPSTLTTKCQAIADVGGCMPLIALWGPAKTHNDLSTLYTQDLAFMQAIDGVFGSWQYPVLLEFGNEDRLSNITAQQYINAWNQVVPQLVAAFSGKYTNFIGPVMNFFDGNWLLPFMQQAVPRPFMISWHEYPSVTDSSTLAQAEAQANTWNGHINTAQQIMSYVGYTVPTIITEWNVPGTAPGFLTDPARIEPWTQYALQIWQNAAEVGNIYATTGFSVANKPNMSYVLANDTLSPQGIAFWPQAALTGTTVALAAPSGVSYAQQGAYGNSTSAVAAPTGVTVKL
jgi:hypothetical protein